MGKTPQVSGNYPQFVIAKRRSKCLNFIITLADDACQLHFGLARTYRVIGKEIGRAVSAIGSRRTLCPVRASSARSYVMSSHTQRHPSVPGRSGWKRRHKSLDIATRDHRVPLRQVRLGGPLSGRPKAGTVTPAEYPAHHHQARFAVTGQRTFRQRSSPHFYARSPAPGTTIKVVRSGLAGT